MGGINITTFLAGGLGFILGSRHKNDVYTNIDPIENNQGDQVVTGTDITDNPGLDPDPDSYYGTSSDPIDVVSWRTSEIVGDIIDKLIVQWEKDINVDVINEILTGSTNHDLDEDQIFILGRYRSDIEDLFSDARYVDTFLTYQINDDVTSFYTRYGVDEATFNWNEVARRTNEKMRALCDKIVKDILYGRVEYQYRYIIDVIEKIRDLRLTDQITSVVGDNNTQSVAKFDPSGLITIDGFSSVNLSGVGNITFDRSTYNTEVSGDRDSLAATIRAHNIPGSFYGWPGMEVRTPSMSVSREFISRLVTVEDQQNGTMAISMGQYAVFGVDSFSPDDILYLATTASIEIYFVLTDQQIRVLAPIGRLNKPDDGPVGVYKFSLPVGKSITMSQYSETIGEKKKWYKRIFGGGSCRQYRNRYRHILGSYTTSAIAVKAVDNNCFVSLLHPDNPGKEGG